MYFSSYPSYTFGYAKGNNDNDLRTTIVEFVNTGKYKEVNKDTRKLYLKGCEIKNPYTSHYVKVKRNGNAYANDFYYKDIIFDEWVIKSGKQCLPYFAITFKRFKGKIIIWRDKKINNKDNTRLQNKIKSNLIKNNCKLFCATNSEIALNLLKRSLYYTISVKNIPKTFSGISMSSCIGVSSLLQKTMNFVLGKPLHKFIRSSDAISPSTCL